MLLNSYIFKITEDIAGWRFFKFVWTAGPGTNVALGEIELKETSGGIDVTTGCTAYASHSIGAGYVAGNAIDNNNTTMWNGAYSVKPSYWSVDLGVPRTIVEYTLRARHNGYLNDTPEAWDIYVSNDNINWTYVRSDTTGNWAINSELRVFDLPVELPQQTFLLLFLPMQEGTGTTLYDISGNGLDFPKNSGQVWGTNPNRLILTNDGGNRRAMTEISSTNSFFFRFANNGNASVQWIYYATNNPRTLTVIIDGDLQCYISGAYVSLGHNIPVDGILRNYVIVHTGASLIHLYVDGVLTSEVAATAAVHPAKDAYIGGYGLSGQGLNGELQGVGIWSGAALNQNEINQLQYYLSKNT
jgi:hypothetical protein